MSTVPDDECLVVQRCAQPPVSSLAWVRSSIGGSVANDWKGMGAMVPTTGKEVSALVPTTGKGMGALVPTTGKGV